MGAPCAERQLFLAHSDDAREGEQADFTSTTRTCCPTCYKTHRDAGYLYRTKSRPGCYLKHHGFKWPMGRSRLGCVLTDPPSPVNPYTSTSGEEGLTQQGRRRNSSHPDALTPSLDVGRQYGLKDYSHQLLLLLHALRIRLAIQEQGFIAGFTFDNFNRSGHLLCYQAVIFRPPDDLTCVVSTVRDFEVLN